MCTCGIQQGAGAGVGCDSHAAMCVCVCVCLSLALSFRASNLVLNLGGRSSELVQHVESLNRKPVFLAKVRHRGHVRISVHCRGYSPKVRPYAAVWFVSAWAGGVSATAVVVTRACTYIPSGRGLASRPVCTAL